MIRWPIKRVYSLFVRTSIIPTRRLRYTVDKNKKNKNKYLFNFHTSRICFRWIYMTNYTPQNNTCVCYGDGNSKKQTYTRRCRKPEVTVD